MTQIKLCRDLIQTSQHVHSVLAKNCEACPDWLLRETYLFRALVALVMVHKPPFLTQPYFAYALHNEEHLTAANESEN